MKTLLEYLNESQNNLGVDSQNTVSPYNSSFIVSKENNKITIDGNTLDFEKLENEIGKVPNGTEIYFDKDLREIKNLSKSQNHYKISAPRIMFDYNASGGKITNQTFISRFYDNGIYFRVFESLISYFDNCIFNSEAVLCDTGKELFGTGKKVPNDSADWYLKHKKKASTDKWLEYLLNNNEFNCEYVSIRFPVRDLECFKVMLHEQNLPFDKIFPECKKLLNKGMCFELNIAVRATKDKHYFVTKGNEIPKKWKNWRGKECKIINNTIEGYNIWEIFD